MRRHGGRAVFAARLDRDEAGQHNVDVFYAPRYTKETKNRKKEAVFTDWISTTKFGKELCEKHREEIMSRNDEGKFSTTPRSTGIALQAELTEFLGRRGLKLEPRTVKASYLADRLETEAYKRISDEKNKAKAEINAAMSKIERDRTELEREKAKLLIEQAALIKEKGRFVRLADRLVKAVSVLSEKLGLTLPKSLQDAVREIEQEVERLQDPEPDHVPDPFEEVSDEASFDGPSW